MLLSRTLLILLVMGQGAFHSHPVWLSSSGEAQSILQPAAEKTMAQATMFCAACLKERNPLYPVFLPEFSFSLPQWTAVLPNVVKPILPPPSFSLSSRSPPSFI